ncbi:chitin deacetylase [Nowakowskiella sp. JEL0407]|nr:chitin deacetylase [Nowakowskiella sp. JEL0407]
MDKPENFIRPVTLKRLGTQIHTTSEKTTELGNIPETKVTPQSPQRLSPNLSDELSKLKDSLRKNHVTAEEDELKNVDKSIILKRKFYLWFLKDGNFVLLYGSVLCGALLHTGVIYYLNEEGLRSCTRVETCGLDMPYHLRIFYWIYIGALIVLMPPLFWLVAKEPDIYKIKRDINLTIIFTVIGSILNYVLILIPTAIPYRPFVILCMCVSGTVFNVLIPVHRAWRFSKSRSQMLEGTVDSIMKHKDDRHRNPTSKSETIHRTLKKSSAGGKKIAPESAKSTTTGRKSECKIRESQAYPNPDDFQHILHSEESLADLERFAVQVFSTELIAFYRTYCNTTALVKRYYSSSTVGYKFSLNSSASSNLSQMTERQTFKRPESGRRTSSLWNKFEPSSSNSHHKRTKSRIWSNNLDGVSEASENERSKSDPEQNLNKIQASSSIIGTLPFETINFAAELSSLEEFDPASRTSCLPHVPVPVELSKKYLMVYKRFFEKGAEMELNLPGTMLKEIRNAVENRLWTLDVYCNAKNEVLNLLEIETSKFGLCGVTSEFIPQSPPYFDMLAFKRIAIILYFMSIVSINNCAPPQLMTWSKNQLHDIYTCKSNSTLALTFDDGPSEYTPALLKKLKEHDVKATFFMLGKQAAKYPKIVKQAYEAGHQIALHTYGHLNLQISPANVIMAEMNAVAETIADLIGVYPTYMRPPFGSIGPREYNILRRMGFVVTLWDIDTKDWDDGTDPLVGFYLYLHRIIENIPENGDVSKLNRKRERGYISLQHDDREHSVSPAKLEEIISLAQERGFKFDTVVGCAGGLQFPAYRSRNEMSPAQRILFADKIDAEAVKNIATGQKLKPIQYPNTTAEEKMRVQNKLYEAARDEMYIYNQRKKAEEMKKKSPKMKVVQPVGLNKSSTTSGNNNFSAESDKDRTELSTLDMAIFWLPLILVIFFLWKRGRWMFLGLFGSLIGRSKPAISVVGF